MMDSYSVNAFHDELYGNHAHRKLHGRGVWLYSPTKDNNQRCCGFVNKEMFRNSFGLFLVMLVMFSSFALAHEGFSTVLENASVNAYSVTVLEDTHFADEQPQTSLMIQVAHGREAAPADTTVKLRLEQNKTIIYENEVPYVGSSSSDGRTFYAYYLITIPLQDLNSYAMTLELDGSLGSAITTVNFQPKLSPEFRATELLPSLLIISICLVAAVVFIASSRRASYKNEPQKGLSHA